MSFTKSIQKDLAKSGAKSGAAVGTSVLQWLDGRGPVEKAATRAESALTKAARPSRSVSAIVGSAAVGLAAAMGGLAYYNIRKTRQDESEHPPIGRFIDVDGVRLHYIDKGKGDVVTLIHGNLTLAEDFLLSGIVDKLAERYRVIVFDRPGFGYSDRPHRVWTPGAYAELLQKAFSQLGVERVTVVTHSFASLIALDLALQYPALVEGLVLIGGYFYPTARADVFFMSFTAIPGLGDVMRYTISPPLTRLFLPGVLRWLFSPAPVTERFEKGFPNSFAARPVQIGAEAEDSVLMVASAMQLQARYAELKLPIVILAGDGDKMVDLDRQSRRFHDEAPQSELIVIPGAGHMAHHTAPDQIVAAVDRVARPETKPGQTKRMQETASSWSNRS
ncbi:alpha/beta fold hydrolase [Methylocystis sp. Sn-Cys]|uniref:alpha/beta fold hydrolase n=1 Tax=Methylocystis sp. Sn-Cys TaxID=1701263 RepID=UPI001FED9865|nr:alpha/beta hydrolase [Methylocystis sp. Sn-Cys]